MGTELLPSRIGVVGDEQRGGGADRRRHAHPRGIAGLDSRRVVGLGQCRITMLRQQHHAAARGPAGCGHSATTVSDHRTARSQRLRRDMHAATLPAETFAGESTLQHIEVFVHQDAPS